MVVHIISVGLTGFYFYLAKPASDLFSWHPVCMSMAFVLLMLQAIMIFSPESSLTPTSPRPDKVQLHWILHAFGMASAVFGFLSVYFNKEIAGRKHFTTWHSKFGLAALVGALIAILGGILAKYNHKFKSYIKPINMKLYHATIGMIIFLLAMIAVSLATYSNYFHNRMKNTPWVGRLCLWAPIILAVCVARQVTQSYLPRILVTKDSAIDAKAKVVQAKVDAKIVKKNKVKQGE